MDRLTDAWTESDDKTTIPYFSPRTSKIEI